MSKSEKISDKDFLALKAFAADCPWNDPKISTAAFLAHRIMSIPLESFDVTKINYHRDDSIVIIKAIHHIKDLHMILYSSKSKMYTHAEETLVYARDYYEAAYQIHVEGA